MTCRFFDITTTCASIVITITMDITTIDILGIVGIVDIIDILIAIIIKTIAINIIITSYSNAIAVLIKCHTIIVINTILNISNTILNITNGILTILKVIVLLL